MCQFVLIQYRCEHTELTVGPVCQSMFIELGRRNVDPTSWNMEGLKKLGPDMPDHCSPTAQNTTRVISTHWCGWECEHTFYSKLASAAAAGRLIAEKIEIYAIDEQGGNGAPVFYGTPRDAAVQAQKRADDQAKAKAKTEAPAQKKESIRATQAQKMAGHVAQAYSQDVRSTETRDQTVHNMHKQAQAQGEADLKAQASKATKPKAKPTSVRERHLEVMEEEKKAMYAGATESRSSSPLPWAPAPAPAPAPSMGLNNSGGNQNIGTIGGGGSGASAFSAIYGGNHGSGDGKSSAKDYYTGAGNGLLEALRNRERERELSKRATVAAAFAATSTRPHSGGVSIYDSIGDVSAFTGTDRMGRGISTSTSTSANANANANAGVSAHRAPYAPRQQWQSGRDTNVASTNASAMSNNRYSQSQSAESVDETQDRFRTHRALPFRYHGAPVAPVGTGQMNASQQSIREALGLTGPRNDTVDRHVQWVGTTTTTHGYDDDEDDEYDSYDDEEEDGDEQVTVTMCAENMADGDVFN